MRWGKPKSKLAQAASVMRAHVKNRTGGRKKKNPAEDQADRN